MVRRLSYCLFSGMEPYESLGNDVVLGGLFCWEAAFAKYGRRGFKSANLSRDLLEEFDIIHVNYTPGNCSYIAAIRDSLGDHSDTKIVTQVDFSVGLWSGMDPFIMRQQLNLADLVFHVEPVGAKILSEYLGYGVPVIPHPVDVVGVKRFRAEPTLPPLATCQYHRYMYTWTPYYYALHTFRKTHGIRSALVNFSDAESIRVPLDSHFDEVVGRMPYEAFLALMSSSFVNFDLTPDYTYGRGVVEAAALGIPTIGSNTIAAMDVIWPELSVAPYDVSAVSNIIEHLLCDPEFAHKMSVIGSKRSEKYNLEHSYDRLCAHLEYNGVF